MSKVNQAETAVEGKSRTTIGVPARLLQQIRMYAGEQVLSQDDAWRMGAVLLLELHRQTKDDPNAVVVIRRSDGTETIIKFLVG